MLSYSSGASCTPLIALLLLGCEPLVDPGETNDAAAPQADASPFDAAPVQDAEPADAGGPEAVDSAAQDGGLADAQALPDASPQVDGALAGDAAVGTNSLVLTSSGETCFGLRSGERDACPARQCFGLSHRVEANIVSAPLGCAHPDRCVAAKPGAPISEYHRTHSYRYDGPELTVVMDLDIASLTEYTLDRLRASLVSAAISVPFLVDGKPQRLGVLGSELELVSYEANMLHLHLKGTVDQLNAGFDDIPHLCSIGHLPTLCNHLFCVYTSDGALPATVDAQVRIQLVAPTP